jgi:hypothetical protein
VGRSRGYAGRKQNQDRILKGIRCMTGAARRYHNNVGMLARESLVHSSKDGSSGGRDFRCLCRSAIASSRGTAAGSFLPLVALVLATQGSLPSMPNSLNTYNLSGSYSFHASFEHPAFQAYGDLDFDWLGDISGEAVAVSHEPRRRPARKCNFLISGDYTLARDSSGYEARLTFMPVDPSCPINNGKEKILRVKIVRRNGHGDLDLIETSPSEGHLFGMAMLQSPGPFWSIT